MFITSVNHNFKLNDDTGSFKINFEIDLPETVLKSEAISNENLVTLIDRYLKISGSFLTNVLIFYDEQQNYRIPFFALSSSLKEIEAKNKFFRDFSKNKALEDINDTMNNFLDKNENIIKLIGDNYHQNKDITDFMLRLTTVELDAKAAFYKSLSDL